MKVSSKTTKMLKQTTNGSHTLLDKPHSLMSKAKRIIPPLDGSLHKGQSGKLSESLAWISHGDNSWLASKHTNQAAWVWWGVRESMFILYILPHRSMFDCSKPTQ